MSISFRVSLQMCDVNSCKQSELMHCSWMEIGAIQSFWETFDMLLFEVASLLSH